MDVKSELESQNALDDNFIRLDHDGNVEIVPDDEDSPDDCILLCGHGWPGDDELAAIAGADWEAGPEQPQKEDEESDLEAVLEKLRVAELKLQAKQLIPDIMLCVLRFSRLVPRQPRMDQERKRIKQDVRALKMSNPGYLFDFRCNPFPLVQNPP